METVHDPAAAWASLGHGGELTLTAVELRLVELSFLHPVQTARGVHRRRPVVLVSVEATGEAGPVVGWGECAALADATYDREDAGTAFAELHEALVPALAAHTAGPGTLPGPAALAPVRAAASDGPLAFAALEMAVADAHLRAGGRSLAALLGVTVDRVPAGAVVGRAGSVPELLEDVERVVARGYPRVKLKIAPGDGVRAVAAVRQRFPDLLLQVDANMGYDPADPAPLLALDQYRLLCIEQPFGRDDLDAHAGLAAALTTPVCLDESLTSPAAVARALAAGACSAVCLKPARLGGLGAALDVLGTCRSAGVPVWVGGMFETAYARGVNATLAALAATEGTTWPGDLSAAAGYLAEDPVGSPVAGGAPPAGDRDGGEGTAGVPGGPGLGPAPDPERMDHLTARQWRWDAE